MRAPRPLLFFLLPLALLLAAPGARAQPTADPAVAPPDATPAAPAASSPPTPPAWPRAPEPSATTTSSAPRPDPGPGVRERGSRGRRSNPASGALFVVVIVAAIGWYVAKKLRRR